MRIIKKGNPISHQIREATCSSCKCKFEFERHEAKFVPDHRDGDALMIKCPQDGCLADVWIRA